MTVVTQDFPSVEGSPQAEEAPSASLPTDLAFALAALSAARPEGLSQAELVEIVSLCEATKGAAAALQARATATFVDERDAGVAEQCARGEISARGARCRRTATRTELALARRCSPNQGDRHVGLAKALVEDLPNTMAALTAGEISEWRATIVARETACLSHEDRLEVDRRLSESLTTLGDRALAGAAHRATADLDPEALVRRHQRAVASRNVSVRPAPDGMAWLSVLGALPDVVGAFAALRKAEQARHVATGDETVDAARAADERGRGAWMSDTALERLSGRAAGEVQPVEVALVMSEGAILPTTADERDEAEVSGFGAVPGAVARAHLLRLADSGARTWLRRLWASPDGRDLVAMDSTRRLFGGALRTLIRLRDATCRIPWCDAPIRDIDHVVPHAQGGQTSAINGMGLCQRHNLAKEAPGLCAKVTSSGVDPGGGPHEVQLTTSTGREYRSLAPPILGHGRPDPVRLVVDSQRSPVESHIEWTLHAA